MRLHARLAAPLLVLAAACNPMKNVASAETAVSRFHEHYNRSELDAIYGGADDAFKRGSDKAEVLRFLGAVRRKLGAEVSAKRTSFNVNADLTKGQSVVLTYDTKFEHGTGVETFTLHVSEGVAQLEGYNINSTALITD
jgi:hypothetical protein